jgi:hypothetical protein
MDLSLHKHGLKESIEDLRTQLVSLLDTLITFTNKANDDFELITQEISSLQAKLVDFEERIEDGDDTGSPPVLKAEPINQTVTIDLTVSPRHFLTAAGRKLRGVPTATSSSHGAPSSSAGNSAQGSSSGIKARITSSAAQPGGKKLKVEKPPSSWVLENPCIFCHNTGHWADACPDFTTYESRMAKVREEGLCIKCLAAHYDECIGSVPCRFCDDYEHHKLLCQDELKKREKEPRASGMS